MEREKEKRGGGGGCDRQRQAEEGRKMKGNLIDEKEEQEKGVAVRERSTLETKKCRARPSERHAGISGASFDEGKLVITPARLIGAQVMTSDEVITRRREVAGFQTSLKHLRDSARHLKSILCEEISHLQLSSWASVIIAPFY